jgi:hypothetical protein
MRVLRSKPEELDKLIKSYEDQVIEIKKNALRMSWYMRGGASYEDILNMSLSERSSINEIIESNMEITKKNQIPFF